MQAHEYPVRGQIPPKKAVTKVDDHHGYAFLLPRVLEIKDWFWQMQKKKKRYKNGLPEVSAVVPTYL